MAALQSLQAFTSLPQCRSLDRTSSQNERRERQAGRLALHSHSFMTGTPLLRTATNAEREQSRRGVFQPVMAFGDLGVAVDTLPSSMMVVPAVVTIAAPIVLVPMAVVAGAFGAIPKQSTAQVRWREKRELLLQKKVKSVTAKEAASLVQEGGYTFLDVRLADEFQKAHPTGSINVPIFRPITEWNLYKIARRLSFAFFGVAGTEENPDLLADVAKVVPDKEAKILIACDRGGTLKATTNFPIGKESKSLIVAYYLATEGYKNLVHVEGGIDQWFQDDLPLEGTELV